VVVARYHVSADPDLADAASGTVILSVPHAEAHHNGRNMLFGPADGDLFIGLPLPELLANIRVPKPGEGLGEVQAWDMKTGKLSWKHKYQSFQWGPLMTTAGNLVFGGGTNDRMFRAFDARNGKLLWETPTPSGVNGSPVTYEVDGEQYVAVQSGWGIDAERMQGSFNTVMKTNVKVPQGGNLMVYKVKP